MGFYTLLHFAQQEPSKRSRRCSAGRRLSPAAMRHELLLVGLLFCLLAAASAESELLRQLRYSSSLGSSSGTSHSIWSNCGTIYWVFSLFWRLKLRAIGSGNDHLQISSVQITPNQPTIGSNVTISIAGKLDETIFFGYSSVVLKWNGYPILNCTTDLYAFLYEPSLLCSFYSFAHAHLTHVHPYTVATRIPL